MKQRSKQIMCVNGVGPTFILNRRLGSCVFSPKVFCELFFLLIAFLEEKCTNKNIIIRVRCLFSPFLLIWMAFFFQLFKRKIILSVQAYNFVQENGIIHLAD